MTVVDASDWLKGSEVLRWRASVTDRKAYSDWAMLEKESSGLVVLHIFSAHCQWRGRLENFAVAPPNLHLADGFGLTTTNLRDMDVL